MATILDPGKLRGSMREALLASNWWAAAIRGVSAIVLGLLIILMPALTLLGLVTIFAVYCLVDGVFAIVLAIRGATKHQRWGWLAFNGIVSLAVAAMALFYPYVTMLALALLFAAWAFVSGATTIVAGVKLSRSHGRWWLIASGVIAVIFGLFMVFLPTLGMLTLTYVVAFQAIFAGTALLVLAFRLRTRFVDTVSSGGSTRPEAAEA
jgi:uncharacterized membrane protein HdeD (DUF308 family)